MKTSSVASVLASRCAFGLVATVLWAAAASAQTSIWSLTPEQRQKLLAEQYKQMLQTQQAQLDMQRQINDAYTRQQLAAAEAQRAQVQAIQAQTQAQIASTQAMQAAMTAGFEQGRIESEKRNMDAAVDMVKSAVGSWQPPKTYSAQAGRVALADPFSDDPAQARIVDPVAELREAVKGTCLTVDADRLVAKVSGECSLAGRTAKLLPGDYPVLASDSSPLDTPERVKAFLTASLTPSSTVLVIRNDSQLVIVR